MSMPPLDIKAMQKRMRDNISSATGAQFSDTGGITKAADTYKPYSASQASAGTSGNTTGGFIPNIVTNANKVLDKPFAGMGATQGMSADMARSRMAQGLPAKQAGVGTTQGMTQGAIPPIKPTYNEQSTTNYGDGALGGILSAKKYYDTGVANNNSGLKGWAANSADKYYSQLTPDVAAKVKSLDTQGLIDYINLNKKVEDTPTDQPTDYKALAEAEWLSLLNDKTRTADEKKNSLKGAWDYSNRLVTDNRTLEDVQLDRTLNPFSGQKNYAVGLVGRERELSDAQALAQYNSAVGEIDGQLADYKNSAAQEIMKRAYDLEQNAKQFGLQEGALTGDYQGGRTLQGAAQDFSQMDATRSYDFAVEQYKRGIFESDRDFKENVRLKGLDYALQVKAQELQAQNMAQDNARGWAGISLDREKFDYNKEQDKLKDLPQSGKAEDYYSFIDSSPSAFTKYEDGKTVQNSGVIEDMILSSGLSNAEMAKLYRRYGIPMN